jgi:hypothetical protein
LSAQLSFQCTSSIDTIIKDWKVHTDKFEKLCFTY